MKEKQEQTPSFLKEQDGQSIVIIAAAMLVLLGFIALAVDGGNSFTKKRVTQNAADASALRGTQYIATGDVPTETGLISTINQMVELNGVPDSDGTPGNEVNDNVEIIYTDDQGHAISGCSEVPCGSIPPPARGVQTFVKYEFPTLLAGVLGINRATVNAQAIAVVRGYVPESISENLAVALGKDCDQEDKPLQGRASNSEFLGGIYSNSWFYNQGEGNHYHVQVYYYTGFDRSFVPAEETFEPQYPISTTEQLDDPFDEILGRPLTYKDFAITGTIGVSVTDFYDVSILDINNPPYTTGDGDGIVEMREIINQTQYPELYNPDDRNDLVASDGVTLRPNQLRQGLYYAGNKAITIGEQGGTNGSVTIVSGNRIKLIENDMNLSSYMQQDSPVPGLLFFSDYRAPELADKCDFDPAVEPIINMAGNSGSVKPEVYHWPDDLPKPPPEDPTDYEHCPLDVGCFIQSSNVFVGLIYAPNGRIATSGGRTTYIGSIIGWTIDINGDENLFVDNSELFPAKNPQIHLIE